MPHDPSLFGGVPPQGAASDAAPDNGAESEQPEVVDAESVQPEAESVDADLQELANKAEKADEYLALAQRLQADFENYRKRAARDAALAQERGISKLAKELLPAIDNLDRAVQACGTEADESDSQLASGVKLVHRDVVQALSRVGIEAFGAPGEPFDPQHHEAVAQNQVDGTAAGFVLEVYQQGYKLGEAVLRPARVLVSA